MGFTFCGGNAGLRIFERRGMAVRLERRPRVEVARAQREGLNSMRTGGRGGRGERGRLWWIWGGGEGGYARVWWGGFGVGVSALLSLGWAGARKSHKRGGNDRE